MTSDDPVVVNLTCDHSHHTGVTSLHPMYSYRERRCVIVESSYVHVLRVLDGRYTPRCMDDGLQ